jgi:pimeloyl-ACP methyl ester carboxylesterase
MTTANVARDVNQIRLALGDSQISFFGISWGTALGAYYRSLFPSTVSRMWLDSVLAPDFRQDQYAADDAQATATDYARMTAWLAHHNATYGLGSTPQQVQAAILAEWQRYNAHPLTFTTPHIKVGSILIAATAAQPSIGWSEAAQVLAQMRGATGPAGPAALQRLTGGGRGPSAPPSGAPQTFNPAMGTAVVCNEDTGQRSFAAGWAAYKHEVREFPVTGELTPPAGAGGRCAGWPLPTQPWHLHHEPGSLVLSAHRYETTTPYAWAQQMKDAVGGTIFTVNDDVHASVSEVPQCSADLVAYFDTRNPGASGCAGVPMSSQPGQGRHHG